MIDDINAQELQSRPIIGGQSKCIGVIIGYWCLKLTQNLEERILIFMLVHGCLDISGDFVRVIRGKTSSET